MILSNKQVTEDTPLMSVCHHMTPPNCHTSTAMAPPPECLRRLSLSLSLVPLTRVTYIQILSHHIKYKRIITLSPTSTSPVPLPPSPLPQYVWVSTPPSPLIAPNLHVLVTESGCHDSTASSPSPPSIISSWPSSCASALSLPLALPLLLPDASASIAA